MNVKSICLAIFVGLLFQTQGAMAATGKIKVLLKNEGGRVINGDISARKGSAAKNCKTRAGGCVIGDVGEGTWFVSAVSLGGKDSGLHTVSVKGGVEAQITLVLK